MNIFGSMKDAAMFAITMGLGYAVMFAALLAIVAIPCLLVIGAAALMGVL